MKENRPTATVQKEVSFKSVFDTDMPTASTKAGRDKPSGFFGRFGKDAITDYVETLLEKSDAKAAEEALENAKATESAPQKPKSFWQKMPFSK